MTSDDLKERVAVMLGLLSSQMTDPIYEIAEIITLSELKWALPTDDPFKDIWLLRRCRRHVIDILFTQSAEAIKHKQSSHDQKFDHFNTLIKLWDKEFLDALEENYNQFAGVDASKIFGTYRGANFVYDFVGNDITGLASES